jgi:hypothetical protein
MSIRRNDNLSIPHFPLQWTGNRDDRPRGSPPDPVRAPQPLGRPIRFASSRPRAGKGLSALAVAGGVIEQRRMARARSLMTTACTDRAAPLPWPVPEKGFTVAGADDDGHVGPDFQNPSIN